MKIGKNFLLNSVRSSDLQTSGLKKIPLISDQAGFVFYLLKDYLGVRLPVSDSEEVVLL